MIKSNISKINKIKFSTNFRGYTPDEVESFLNKVKSSFEIILNSNIDNTKIDSIITPEEIHNVKFTQSTKGYDVEEVDEFLYQLEKTLLKLRKEHDFAPSKVIDFNVARTKPSEQSINLLAQKTITKIENAKFKSGFRGYNPNEVEAFLQKVNHLLNQAANTDGELTADMFEPSFIEEVKFTQGFRGYNVVPVDALLDEVEKAFADISTQLISSNEAKR